MIPNKYYKHENCRDVVFYCLSISTNGVAKGYYFNCHYYELGVRKDLFLCDGEIYHVNNPHDEKWKLYNYQDPEV